MGDARIFLPVQPHFDFNDEQLNQLLENNQDFIFGPHHFSPITSDFNFPVTIPVSSQEWIRDIHLCLESVLNLHQEESYKVNFTLGFILRHRETGDYRYFVPHSNNSFFSSPVRIDRPSSRHEVFTKLNDEALISYVTNHRQDTKWIPLMITNVHVHLYHLGVCMGQGPLPDFITESKVIVGLSKDRWGNPYEDELCALRCLAFHCNLLEKGNGYLGLENKTKFLQEQWGNAGLNLMDVARFEETFTIHVDIFTLFDDGSVAPRYLSKNRYKNKMVLNLYENHLSYVTKPSTFLNKYRCDSCERHFAKLFLLQRHQGSCVNATKFKFPGQAHKMSFTIFDNLEEFDIVVPPDERTYPWFAVYDFEAILSRLEEEPPTPQLKWLRRHDPISVSVASNVTGFSDKIYEEAKQKWKYVFDKLEERFQEMAGHGLRADDDKDEEEDEDGETIHQTPMTEEEITDKEWRRTHDKLVALQLSFNHYCRQVPVLGFNSAKYDLNLVKSHLIPWLQSDVAPNSEEKTTDIGVIKKGSSYTQISGRRFKFLDVINYLAGGFSYDKFLKAYKIPQMKSYFPYEWFDHVDKLNHPCLPGYETFYSELKKMNVLEVKDMAKAAKTGPARYQELQQIWQDHNMTTFKDFLIYYNNLDVGPFVSAVEKMQQFYFEHNIDLFKVAVSVPGIARRWLFKTAHDAKASFALIHPKDDDLYYTMKQNIVGGPSIIFTREAEVGRTFIRNDPNFPCRNIVGYDANALYLDCIDKDQPCGGYVRRTAPDFRPDTRLQHEDMYHWMDYVMETEQVNIKHARNYVGEVRIGPYLVDGYDPVSKTVYEYNGCYYHGCSVCHMDQSGVGQARKKHTETKESYLKQSGYTLRIMWEHEFKELQKKDQTLKQFIQDRMPPFYRSHRRKTKESTLLKAVLENTLFGFLEVDIHVPESLQTYFEEMPPLFCNTDVIYDDIGPFMQQYVKDQGLTQKPRHLLVSGMKAQKILLSSPYLKWLLQKGLLVTKIYQVIEYAPKRCFRQFVKDVSDAQRAGDGDEDQKMIAEIMKLIGNSGYGSLIMDKEKHRDVLYVNGRGRAQMKINDPRFTKCTIIQEDVYEMEMLKSKITFVLPIQLGYHILQLAKLRMLQFRYDCLDSICKNQSYEYLEMDTDSAYLALNGNTLDELVIPTKKNEHQYAKMGQCRDFQYTSEDGFFPRECCEKHIAYDKRTPGLFKVEAQGKAMVALCSKTYILKKHNDEPKFSSKGLNKSALKDPYASFRKVLDTKQPQCSTNQGFRPKNNTIYTYEQTKGGLSYFYCKRMVMDDGIHTKPFNITLTPWPLRQLEVVEKDHPWSLDMRRKFKICGETYSSLADVCQAAKQQQNPRDMINQAIAQLPPHVPLGKVLMPLPSSLRTKMEWKHDTYWTTGLSSRSSPLRLKTPGQNQLGQFIEHFMTNYTRDHNYI